MNFLAHFLLAQAGDPPEFHLGAVLPDLARRAGFRLQEIHLSGLDYRTDFHMINGIRYHWKADAEYHQSALFLQGCEIWKSLISKEIPGQIGRKFFLYHLLSEMWLDRILLKNFPDSGQMLYQSIGKVEDDPLHRLAHLLCDHQLKLVDTRDDFLYRQFILDYSDPLKFARIAASVFSYASRQSFSPALQEIIASALPSVDKESGSILPVWMDFFDFFNARHRLEQKV